MLLPPSPVWYSATPKGKLTSTQNEFEFAKQLLEKDSEEYERSQSDKIFIQKILSTGTTADKLSTLTLLTQQSPAHNTKALHSLAQLGQKKSRSEALKALRAFTDWWSAGGAPSRKLRYWTDQPNNASSDAQRILFYFEDWLKKLFWEVLQTLERLSLDPLPYVRTQATTLIHSLLSAKPEQEHNLLRLLVNKLGDSSRQLASRASYHILQLLEPHPAMKTVIVDEIASLILRAPLSTSAKVHVERSQGTEINSHARYYAIITLNQIVLSHSEQDMQLARKLVHIYFDMFYFLLHVQEKSPEAINNEKGSDRLKGRTEMKKVKVKKQQREERTSRSSKGKSSGEAFVEIEQGHERFIGAVLTGLHRAVPYASLDANEFEKHTNTLFKLTHESTFNISLQAMLLIQALLSCAPASIQSKDASQPSMASTSNIQTRFLRTLYSSLHDPRLRTSSKKSMYLNLLLKAMKRPYQSSSTLALENSASEQKIRRALWRRLIAVALSGVGMAGENEVVCGSMFILGEVQSGAEELRKIGKEVPKRPRLDKDDKGDDSKEGDTENEYDARKREPEFACAEATPIWELASMSNHYHPSVSLHARQLLDGRPVTANTDLSLNTLSHFLDRFVYKNPKKPTARSSSSMQPSAPVNTMHARDGGVWVGDGASLEKMLNEEQFRKRKIGSIPADQVFFHKFFSKRHELDEVIKKQTLVKQKTIRADDNDAIEDEDDEQEQEQEIWEAMQATISRPGEEDADLMEESASGPDFSGTDSEDGELLDGDDETAGLDFTESEEDILDSDAELPDDFLLKVDTKSVSGEEWGGINSKTGQKRKSGTGKSDVDTEGGRKKMRKIKHLPTFASLDDYEKLINQSPEDNI